MESSQRSFWTWLTTLPWPRPDRWPAGAGGPLDHPLCERETKRPSPASTPAYSPAPADSRDLAHDGGKRRRTRFVLQRRALPSSGLTIRALHEGDRRRRCPYPGLCGARLHFVGTRTRSAERAFFHGGELVIAGLRACAPPRLAARGGQGKFLAVSGTVPFSECVPARDRQC